MKKRITTGAVVLTAAGLFAVGGVGTATAAKLITGEDIARNAISDRHLAADSVGGSELKPAIVDRLRNGKPGTLSNAVAGAGYTNVWEGDGGATLQTARGECAAGQVAVGGGWSTWGGDKDLGGDNRNIVVTVSAPYFEGEYVPVNEGGDFRPREWVVKGYNLGNTDQIVRPWVVCADAE